MTERFSAGNYPYDDGQYYVWDRERSSIVNPDTGRCDSPWRKIYTKQEAEQAAALLNKGENDLFKWELGRIALRAHEDEGKLI